MSHENLEAAAVKAFSIPHDGPPAAISDMKGVASYNWVEDGGAVSLAVPGSPRVWRNPRLPIRVPADNGFVFIDQNAARCDDLGTSPLTPIFLAVDEVSPAFDYKSLDLVSDRNNLRKLLRWATKSVEEQFRIDVELVGTKTLAFSRCEKETAETIPPEAFRGFGQTFRRTVTSTGGVLDSTGHHRVITYNLAGLKVLLRFKVDACLPSVSDLADALGGIDLSSTSTSTSTPKESQPETSAGSSSSPTTTATTPIVIQPTGTPLVAHDRLLELKTMTQKKTVTWDQIYPQLHLSCTPHLYVAKHTRGAFTTVERYGLRDAALRRYAIAAELGLGKLVEFLKDLSSYLQEAGPGIGFSLIGGVSGDLKLYRRKLGTSRGLTEEIIARFT